MNGKHNKALTQIARKLRMDMTREERHLWYDFLREYPIRFLRQKVETSLHLVVENGPRRRYNYVM